MGGRSATAAQALSEAGWTAENLTGGAVAWAAGEADARGAPAPARLAVVNQRGSKNDPVQPDQRSSSVTRLVTERGA